LNLRLVFPKQSQFQRVSAPVWSPPLFGEARPQKRYAARIYPAKLDALSPMTLAMSAVDATSGGPCGSSWGAPAAAVPQPPRQFMPSRTYASRAATEGFFPPPPPQSRGSSSRSVHCSPKEWHPTRPGPENILKRSSFLGDESSKSSPWSSSFVSQLGTSRHGSSFSSNCLGPSASGDRHSLAELLQESMMRRQSDSFGSAIHCNARESCSPPAFSPSGASSSTTAPSAGDDEDSDLSDMADNDDGDPYCWGSSTGSTAQSHAFRQGPGTPGRNSMYRCSAGSDRDFHIGFWRRSGRRYPHRRRGRRHAGESDEEGLPASQGSVPSDGITGRSAQKKPSIEPSSADPFASQPKPEPPPQPRPSPGFIRGRREGGVPTSRVKGDHARRPRDFAAAFTGAGGAEASSEGVRTPLLSAASAAAIAAGLPQSPAEAMELSRLETRLQELVKLPKDTQRRGSKELLVRWHPDKNPERNIEATRVFQWLQNRKNELLGL